jgi:hypothetical protein
MLESHLARLNIDLWLFTAFDSLQRTPNFNWISLRVTLPLFMRSLSIQNRADAS